MRDRNFLAELLQNPSGATAQPQGNPIAQAMLSQPTQELTSQPLATQQKFTPISVLDSRQALANSLLQQASDRSVHPIARGLAAYFGSKASKDIDRERTKTEEAVAAQEAERLRIKEEREQAELARKAAMEDRLFGLKEREVGIEERGLDLTQEKFKDESNLRRQELADKRETDKLQREKLSQEIKNLQNGNLSSEDAFNRSKNLRKEFIDLSGDFINQRDAFGRMQSVADEIKNNPDSAGVGDIALIFNFMKVQDPGSTVREGEFATAENSGGISETYRNLYNKVLDGKRLTPKQREDFLSTSKAIFESSRKQNIKLIDQYSGLAERAGIKKEDVLIDLGLAEITTKNKGESKGESKGSVLDVNDLINKYSQ